MGWYKTIMETLNEHEMPTDLATITSIPRRTWAKIVKDKMEQANKKRLYSDCHKTQEGVEIPKTKTVSIIDAISDPYYVREMNPSFKHLSKQECKSLVIARYGMLHCGRNYKGSLGDTCKSCNVLDDEEHRLNKCPLYKTQDEPRPETNFNEVFTQDVTRVRNVLTNIEKVWNTHNANGTVREMI